MGKLNRDNLRKTVYYLKKNGLENTILAATERLQKKEYDAYTYESLPQSLLDEQSKRCWKEQVVFSIVVPLYHTPAGYFKELVESVRIWLCDWEKSDILSKAYEFEKEV